MWGSEYDFNKRTIEQHIYKLRKKLSLCEARGVIIRTLYQHGYRIEECDPKAAVLKSVPKKAPTRSAARSLVPTQNAVMN